MAEIPPILFVGGGTMARAIVGGAVEARCVPADRLIVLDPSEATHAAFSGWGVPATADPRHAVRSLEAAEHATTLRGMIFLATKPQVLPEAADGLRAHLGGVARTAISILAGTTRAGVKSAFGSSVQAVIRVMPNTPAQIGLGMSAISPDDDVPSTDLNAARTIFGAIGQIIDLDESLIDAFTAVGGSGPAYVFHLAEAMIAGAVGVGFDALEADAIVRQTILGAATLLARSDQEAGDLRVAVTSKGGTTAAALGVLAERDLMDAMTAAIIAARDRGRELGGG